MACVGVPGDFNDKISSAVVYRTTQYGGAIGYWKAITATESIDF